MRCRRAAEGKRDVAIRNCLASCDLDIHKRAGKARQVSVGRLVELVGESPMHYLAGWRMHLAKHLLRDSTLSVGEIAGRVGYESEAALQPRLSAIGRPAPRRGASSRVQKQV